MVYGCVEMEPGDSLRSVAKGINEVLAGKNGPFVFNYAYDDDCEGFVIADQKLDKQTSYETFAER